MPELTTNATTIRYRIDGPADTPVLVLGNSIGTTAELWDAQVPALARYFRVLRYELRGHGGSPAPPGPYSIADLGGDVLALLDGLGIARASICGVSLGGMVAMWVASHAPERVDRLALCGTSAYLGRPEHWAERAATVRANGTAVILDAVLDRWLTAPFRANNPAAVAHVTAMLAAVDAEGYAGCCEAIAAMDERADLAAITAPTLVLAGADDPATPSEHAAVIHAGIANSTLVVVDQAAHLANIGQPVAFTDALLAHLLGDTSRSDAARHAMGMAMRRRVLGDAPVDRAVKATDDFTADFQDLITRYAWGEIWTRPGLDRRIRSAITIAMLVALGRFDELALHLRGAVRNGLSRDEIAEVLLQSAIYCGVPAANAAFAVARETLREFGREE